MGSPRALHRFPFGTSYRDLLALIEGEMHHRALPPDTPLVIDATGVGEVMVDLLKGSALNLVPVTTTSADREKIVFRVTDDPGSIRDGLPTKRSRRVVARTAC